MSDTADAHPEAGSIQGGERPSDESGMSVDDAATSAYDDADRAQNGIAEGEREGMGQWLKSHADHAGTTVHEGLQSLVQTAAVIRNGDQATKREMLGFLVDQYGVRGVPGVEEPAPQFDEFGDPVGRAPQQAIASEAAAMEGVHEFIRANPNSATLWGGHRNRLSPAKQRQWKVCTNSSAPTRLSRTRRSINPCWKWPQKCSARVTRRTCQRCWNTRSRAIPGIPSRPAGRKKPNTSLERGKAPVKCQVAEPSHQARSPTMSAPFWTN